MSLKPPTTIIPLSADLPVAIRPSKTYHSTDSAILPVTMHPTKNYNLKYKFTILYGTSYKSMFGNIQYTSHPFYLSTNSTTSKCKNDGKRLEVT